MKYMCALLFVHISVHPSLGLALGPFFVIVLRVSHRGRKTREINYVSCWWGFDVKSWGKCCSVTFSPHLLYVIQRVQPPPKSASPSCCLLPAFRDISHVIRAAHKFDLNLMGKIFCTCFVFDERSFEKETHLVTLLCITQYYLFSIKKTYKQTHKMQTILSSSADTNIGLCVKEGPTIHKTEIDPDYIFQKGIKIHPLLMDHQGKEKKNCRFKWPLTAGLKVIKNVNT